MKRILYFAIGLFVFASCNKNETGSFTVSGKIKNPSGNTVYLEQLSYESADAKIIDSAKIGADGSYKLKGNSAQQNLYVLSIKDNHAVILINDAKDIKIDFDLNGFHYPSVNGSNATKQLYSFIEDYWQKDSMLSLTYYQLDTIGEEGMKDTAHINHLQQQYAKELNALDDVIRNFITKSDNPAAICFALDKAKGNISPDELSVLVQNASKRFPQHSGIAIFKSSITQTVGGPYTLLNKPAPDLSMPDVNGKNLRISDYRGKYLLVDFWASWCAPCRRENPNVVKAYEKFKNKNFMILGVSLDDDKKAWLQAIKEDHLDWPQMSDLQQTAGVAASTYQFDGIPFNVLIDPQGKIIAAGLRDEALDSKLTQVLQ
jgi:peroxiredoxin